MEQELTKVSFVLDYSPNVNHTGIYVAIDKGWFAEEGIEVEVVPVPADGADALIGSGGADMGVSYQDYIANSLASDAPMPYTAVAAIVQHNTSGIMSRAEDGITSAKGMENHVYATWNMPIEQATIKQIVEADGGDFSKVQMVPYEVDDEVAGLRANMFDTVWVYEWWAVQNAKLQDYPVNYFSFADMDPVFDYYTPVIAANDDFAAQNPELVKGFLRAAKRGYEFAPRTPPRRPTSCARPCPSSTPSSSTPRRSSSRPSTSPTRLRGERSTPRAGRCSTSGLTTRAWSRTRSTSTPATRWTTSRERMRMTAMPALEARGLTLSWDGARASSRGTSRLRCARRGRVPRGQVGLRQDHALPRAGGALTRPLEGQVLLDGEDVTGVTGRVSYMLQKDLLLPHLTVLDNACLPLVLRGMRATRPREGAAALGAALGWRGSRTCGRRSSRAACASARPSCAPTSWATTWCCSTSRSRRSMPSRAPRCAGGTARWRASWGLPRW